MQLFVILLATFAGVFGKSPAKPVPTINPETHYITYDRLHYSTRDGYWGDPVDYATQK